MRNTRNLVQRHPELPKAFRYKCAICGWGINLNTASTRTGGCDLHHIVHAANGGSEDVSNLVLLCPNCHRKAHLGLISESELKQHAFTEHSLKEEQQSQWCELQDECYIDLQE